MARASENRNNRCAICGKSEGKLDCHHLVSRSVGVLRHDPRNGILLCPLHHVYDSTLSAHKGTLLFFLRLQEHEMVDLKYLTERMMIKKSMTDRVWLEEVSELLSNHTQK